MALETDDDLTPALNDVHTGQPQIRLRCMHARAHVVLEPMPGAHDVKFVREKVAETAALVVESFDYTGDEAPLADGAAEVSAGVFPGIQLSPHPEDSDFEAADIYDHASALQDVLAQSNNEAVRRELGLGLFHQFDP